MGDATRIVDMDAEGLLRHFCLEDQCTHIVEWFKEEGFVRPEEYEDRIGMAKKAKDLGNEAFGKADYMIAMKYALAALHCLDFSSARSLLHSDSQKREINEALAVILSNLSNTFLKRGDAYNSARAADLGLEFVKRLPDVSDTLKAKLLFRRGLAKGQTRDFEPALADLREAARLMPMEKDVRRALENCKVAIKEGRGAPDDKWRGLLGEAPEQAQRVAQNKRWWATTRAVAREVLRLAVDPANRKATIMIVVGPLFAMLLPALLAHWSGQERVSWFTFQFW